MIGKILVYIAFTLAVTSGISFFSVHRGKDKLIKYARIFFISSVIFILAISAFQMYNILTHQFQFTYVWEQSNRELGLGLLMSTFYSGQEGSFMLWTLLTSVVGLFLLNYVRKGDRLEPQVMSVFSLILAFLTFILILKSPFNYVWESFPEVPSVHSSRRKGIESSIAEFLDADTSSDAVHRLFSYVCTILFCHCDPDAE